MATFVKPKYTKGEVNRAGDLFAGRRASPSGPDRVVAFTNALDVVSNWRVAHYYPINTFQATLRFRLANIDPKALVAQRLKRLPSIISKLERLPQMDLVHMQDIGGLRAVVPTIRHVRRLEKLYKSGKLAHKLHNAKDYIAEPKADGYRGIHLIYRYKNKRAPEYDGLYIELQLRTRRQHAWATAVETMGTYLGQALKSGYGDKPWRDFFATSAAAVAHLEQSPPVPGFEGKPHLTVFQMVANANDRLQVLEKLESFALATDMIKQESGRGSFFHLVVLDSEQPQVFIRPYPRTGLEEASKEYARIEELQRAGRKLEAVLVSAGPVEALRKAYPNYFLDTQEFVAEMRSIIKLAAEARRYQAEVEAKQRK